MQKLIASDRIVLREVADGSGPSHVIPIGRYLLVVDPWSSEIRRYALDDLAAPPALCLFPRSFAPWRTVAAGPDVRLIAEPFGANERGDYALRSRETMVITPANVDAMPIAGPCRFPIIRYNARHDAPPAMTWRGGERPGSTASLTLANGARAEIAPRDGLGSRIFAAREAGALLDRRTLIWWSEITGYADAGSLGSAGRVAASQYVGIVGSAGGMPETVIRIETAAHPPLVPGGAIAVPRLLVKPGFEYATGAVAAGRDSLFIVAADMEAPSPRPFVIRRYDLNALAPGGSALVSLLPPAGDAIGAIDRNDAATADGGDDVSTGEAPSAPRDAWFARAKRLLQDQAAFAWRYPAGAAARPCGGADRCAVGANDAGALGVVGSIFPNPVHDRIDTTGGARWMRPRHLIGMPAGTLIKGIPYSIGGQDLTDSFAARLTAGYGAGSSAFAPPIGHIREGIEWENDAGHYPLGIDCSALIAKVFDLDLRSTAGMVKAQDVRTAQGRLFRLPRGPARACPEPVRHVSRMREGDVLVRDGHVVIYAGTLRIGGKAGGSRGWRVFEASSRCGKVCESVYDPTYFAGWWIIRLRLGDDASDCPRWLDKSSEAVDNTDPE